MSYGIEIYDANGDATLTMQDFTYTQIFETTIPAPGNDTSVYQVVVPGYSASTCIVLFTPISYITGDQPGFLIQGSGGFVPVYKDLGGDRIGVIRRAPATYYDSSNQRYQTYYTTTAASRMQVFRFAGG